MIIKDCMKYKVFSIPATATIREAAAVVVEHHIGMLPVVDEQGKLMGVVGLRNLLSLELPDFFYLLDDVDFVHDFGVVETTRPEPEQLECPVTDLLQPATSAIETCGLLRASALMLKHKLHDLPVVTEDNLLVGIASRVDIGVAILSSWKTVGMPET
jgi:CBS domain-containing protein